MNLFSGWMYVNEDELVDEAARIEGYQVVDSIDVRKGTIRV
jgi:hypothetical protein